MTHTASRPSQLTTGANRKSSRRRRLRLESLENRIVLANASLAEIEPNNTTADAQLLSVGFDPGEQTDVVVAGDISTPNDHDWYRVELNAGDVVGVRVLGQGQLDPTAGLWGPDATLLMFNDNHRTLGHNYNAPNESPLAGFNSSNSEDSILRYVVSAPGSYFVEVSAANLTVGNYRMELIVSRPGMETRPAGTQQILFVDFDGATVNMSDGKLFGAFGGTGKSTLSPLRDFLPYWGFDENDAKPLIDAILSTIEENFQDAVANGTNPDASLLILNSEEHADEFGVNPFVSRVIIGGTLAETDLEGGSYPIFAFAQHVDVGNFDLDDSAVVLLDELSGMVAGSFNYEFDLNQFDVDPDHTKIEMVGTALGNIASHEVGHNLGNFHSLDATNTGNIMGRQTPWGFDLPGAGPDGIFGNADDVDKHFRSDAFSQREPFGGVGINDTLNNTAWALTTGKAPLAAAEPLSVSPLSTQGDESAGTAELDRQVDDQLLLTPPAAMYTQPSQQEAPDDIESPPDLYVRDGVFATDELDGTVVDLDQLVETLVLGL